MTGGRQSEPALAPELRSLQGDALLLWGDIAERRRAVHAIVSALGTGDAELAEAIRRVDAAVTAGLVALGLPRGPVRQVLIEGGIGPYGRKEPDSTLRLFGDRLREVLAGPRGADSVFRTWVHESIHARQPFAEGYDREYRAYRGYEEGVAEGLARIITRDRARMDPLLQSYSGYVAAYEGLAKAAEIDLDGLLRRLWLQPLGHVRSMLVETVDELRGQRIGRSMSAEQRARLRGVADRLFDSGRADERPPGEDAMLTLWRFVFR